MLAPLPGLSHRDVAQSDGPPSLDQATFGSHANSFVPECLPEAASGSDVTTRSAVATSQTSGRLETVDQLPAVVGSITIRGQHFETLLPKASFDKTRVEQIAHAETLGYRLATYDENREYARTLLAKELDRSINDAEQNALATYRDGYVRDSESALYIDGRTLRTITHVWVNSALPTDGALFVRECGDRK